MKERTCKVFMFLSCTTAPTTALSSGLETEPCTLRAEPSFWAKPAGAQAKSKSTMKYANLTRHPVTVRVIASLTPLGCGERGIGSLHGSHLFPVLVGILLLFFDKTFFVFFVFVFFGRFEFQGGSPDHFERRAALIAADGVAFVHIFFIDVDTAFACRTCDHLNSSR